MIEAKLSHPVKKVPRRHVTNVPFPTALLPALGVVLLGGSVLSSASGFALLRVLQAYAQKVPEVPRMISRKFSRTLSGVGRGTDPRIWPRRLALGVLAAAAARALLQFRRAMISSLALMNPVEESLDLDVKTRMMAIWNLPMWGEGLPRPPRRGEWRRYLYGFKDAHENLDEITGMLGLSTRAHHELTLDQLTEGVRRVLLLKFSHLLPHTNRYWTQAQASTIAEDLAVASGLEVPLRSGGLEECVPYTLPSRLPWPTPLWIQYSQRWGIAALRPIFLGTLGWTSRYVETPMGLLHVYDTHPGSSSVGGRPPLLLQHGMFVTGWSMALLGWLLANRGRRVIMPDLFDFDHGLSQSFASVAGSSKVRSPVASLDALICVLKDLLDEGAQEVDIAGHSFGGWLAGLLAKRCAHEGVRVRKVVMLSPGGPFIWVNHSSIVQRLLQDPDGTIDAQLPSWAPAWPFKALVRCVFGVLLSVNNVNLLIGLRYSEYLGWDALGTERPTLLLWGDEDYIARPRRPKGLVPFIRARFPNVEGYWVKGGGHNIQLDSAVAVARRMEEWLDPPAQGAALGASLAERVLLPTHRGLEPMELEEGGAGHAAQDAVHAEHSRL